jgi:hypothetical protein
MSFNVGDKVRVRSDLEVGGNYQGVTLFEGEMASYRGKVGQITGVDVDEVEYDQVYQIDGRFYFSNEMLEPNPIPTPSKIEEELKKIKPLLEEFVNKYCCPHDILVVQQGSVELYSGQMVLPMKILD